MGDVIVEIEQGKLQGRIAEDINGKAYRSFQGIPYAKPPVGKLRFMAPEPPEAWEEEILDATKERSICYSPNMLNPREISGSEDCLFLNVYTPITTESTEKLPVMVWIHGGGFFMGSGDSDIYGPEFLMAKCVVLVTINYRLGFLGFLSLKDQDCGATGNAGLKDQVEALRWVQKNIEKFNGDPNNVTIFGESAGAASVNFLLLSPQTKGLFHKAIMQSGCVLNTWVTQPRLDYDFVKHMGCTAKTDKEILEFLQEQTVEDILKAQTNTFPIKYRSMGELCYAVPSIEPKIPSAFLTEPPEKILQKGLFHQVPIIIGMTSHEGLLYINPELMSKFGPDFIENTYLVPRDLQTSLKTRKAIEEAGNKIKKFYYGDESPSFDLMDTYLDYCTDVAFAHKIQRVTKLLALKSTSAPVYSYMCKLDTKLGLIKNEMGIDYTGTCHADDLGYLFKTSKSPQIEPDSPEAVGINIMTTLWTNFAKTGNPNNPKNAITHINVEWQPFTPKDDYYLEIDTKLQLNKSVIKDRLKFWDDLYKSNGIWQKV